MKKMIQKHEIGHLRYMQFTRMGLGPVRNDTNVIYDLAAHDVSIAVSLTGMLPSEVSATGASFLQPNIEDVAFIQLTFPGNILAEISVSWLDPIKQRVVKVVGEKKMLLFNDLSISEKLKIIETGTNYQNNSGDFGNFQLSVKDGDIVIPNISNNEPLVNEFEHFIACIKGKEQPLTGPNYASAAVKILDAAHASIKQNGSKIFL